jgi:hypothetical protein
MVIKRDGWNETLVCIFAAFIDTSGYSDSPAPSGGFAYADHISRQPRQIKECATFDRPSSGKTAPQSN